MDKNNCAEVIEENVQSFGARLSKFIDNLGMNKKRFADEIGMSPQSISNYCAGRNQPKPKLLETLVQRFGANREWLMTGSGPMMLSDAGKECSTLAAEEPARYEAQVVDLKHRLADQMLETAQIREAMGKQQSLIFEAVRRACREQNLTPEQTRALQWAVMDYEGAQDSSRLAEQDDTVSHQKAVGD